MSVLSLEDFRHHRATSPTWSAARHHTRTTLGVLARTLTALWLVTRPWVVPAASYLCFTVAAALLTPAFGWAVAGVCLLIAHAQAHSA